MQRIKLSIALAALLLHGCKPYSYFATSNDVLNEPSTVYLLNGSVKTGKLTMQLENENNKGIVRLRTAENSEEKITIDSIQYYVHNREYFYPKKLDLHSYEIPNRYNLYLTNVRNILFLKRLTPENSKIQFYELYYSKIKSPDGVDHYDYFISFSKDSRLVTWDIRGSKFFPNFKERMSSLVSDCPELSNKIRQEVKGYAVDQVSIDAKKYAVFKRIIEEYNSCK